jgi:glycosyltransferase involved in cell wall biosynthesis
MARKIDFSVVIPTYSGASTIGKTFESILKQDRQYRYELIVVIDGPHQELSRICAEIKPRFEDAGVSMKITQFPQNRGRFVARLEGAKLASTNQLLFIDDRVAVERDYFSNLVGSGARAAMPNVIEVEQQTRPISLTMRQLRQALYRGRWGEQFADHYVDNQNFESLPKGTTSLWVPKDVFIAACQRVASQRSHNSKYTNDDTRILKEVVEAGTKILRSSQLTIYYHPRSDFKKEISHLFGRGTIFVDYYSRPGTRLFPVFVVFYLILAGLVAVVWLWPQLIIFCLVGVLSGLLGLALAIAGLSKNTLPVFWGLILIAVVFGAGVIKGTALMLKALFQRRRDEI